MIDSTAPTDNPARDSHRHAIELLDDHRSGGRRVDAGGRSLDAVTIAARRCVRHVRSEAQRAAIRTARTAVRRTGEEALRR